MTESPTVSSTSPIETAYTDAWNALSHLNGSWDRERPDVTALPDLRAAVERLAAALADPLPEAVLTDDALTCPVEGCTADTYLVETGYERQWTVSVEDGVVKAEFGGTQDWSEFGAGDDHVRCGDGHESNLPVDFNSVDYV